MDQNNQMSIDITNSDEPVISMESAQNGIVIDSIDDSNSVTNVVDLNTIRSNSGKHQVIVPKQKNSLESNARKTVTISAIPTEPEKDRDADIKDSIESELLNLDDPDSVLSKYIKKEKEEMEEWVATKEEENKVNKILEDEELAIDDLISDPIKNESSFDIGITNDTDEYYTDNIDSKVVHNNIDISKVEVEDISNLFDTNNIEEDKKQMSEIINDELDELIPEMPLEAETLVLNPEVKNTTEELEEIVEDPIEEEDEVEDTESLNIESAKTEKKESVVKPEVSSLDLDIDTNIGTFEIAPIEEDDEAETVANNVDRDEALKHLQKLATERLKPVSQKLDISSFTVLKKPVVDVSKAVSETNARIIKWVLPYQESTVFMKEFSGSELEKLREYSNASRSADALNRRFKMIYDHIESPKPANYETWLKTTPYNDVDHYFFAIYVASFKGSNYLPEDCVNKDCKETFLTEDIDIMKMVKFETEEDKKKFATLYQSEATPAGKGIYCTEVVPLNNKFAVSFREPSISNLIEIASLEQRAIDRFSSIIEYIPYIDTIYLIDTAAQTLTPISYKMYPDNNNKTIISKIAKYDSIFSLLSVDEFGPIKSYIRAITEKKSGISYIYPAVNCPKCGTLTNEITATAEELVFTRYQLGALTTTSLS